MNCCLRKFKKTVSYRKVKSFSLFIHQPFPLHLICLGSVLQTVSLSVDAFFPQLENVVQKSMKQDVPSHFVHNQTATMLEIGTNLLTHTAEQTRKLNVVEAKVTGCR